MTRLIHYPERIPKEGVYRHLWCEECQCERNHLIQFRRNLIHRETIQFAKFCVECYIKWQQKKELANKFGGEIEREFYGRIDEHDYQKWNQLLKLMDWK